MPTHQAGAVLLEGHVTPPVQAILHAQIGVLNLEQLGRLPVTRIVFDCACFSSMNDAIMSLSDMSPDDIYRDLMDVYEQLPLTESTFFVLLSLAPGPKHGYAILKDVEALSDGRLVLSTGTLYGALKRMLDGVWIERVPDPEPDESNRERKAYRLTKLGRRILDAETARLRRLVGLAELQGGMEDGRNAGQSFALALLLN